MRHMVTFTVAFRRIRTAAGLPPPFGHPPHKCGGQEGAVLTFGDFRIASAYQEIAAAYGLALTEVVGGWFVCADTAFRSAENLAMMGKFSEMYRTSAIIEDPLG